MAKKSTATATKSRPRKSTASKSSKKTSKKPANKSSKKSSKKVAASSGEHGHERSKDVPWSEKKVAVFKALKKLKAVGVDRCRPATDIATSAGVTTKDVRHYCYHAKASGLTGIAVKEGIRGYGFYLTAKGSKVNPAKELKDSKNK